MSRAAVMPLTASVLLAVVIAGCGVVESGYGMLRSDYTSWEGHPARDLLDSWGQPDVTDELGPDYLTYTWIADDGRCRRTFTSRAGTISGHSETDCQDQR
jgi:hypothetical protein